MSMYQVIRSVKSKEITLPAPIMGLNRKQPLSAMEPLYAVTMDNYIPLDSKVELRPGYTEYANLGTGAGGVQTLAAYHFPNNNRFFAVYDNKIWNITSRGNPESDMGITLSESYCQTVQYKNYLYFMNGADTPKAFYIDNNNVEHIGDWGFTGTNLTASKIIAGAVSKEFLWFVEKDSLTAWYTAQAGNISGTLNSFDLSQFAKWGGYLVAIANWTIDGGTGIDDYTAFITSEGEIFVYAGTNPNDAGSWELKGTYKISKPIGYRSTMQYQGDVIIICQDGYFPMGKALAAANAGDSLVAYSDNIRGLVIDRTANNKWRKGWQSVVYNKKGYAIFNVPVSEQFEQHVVNVATGAWCRFVNIRARCWCVFDDDLYFGSDWQVFKFDDSNSDNGTTIEGVVEQAFNDFGIAGVKKISLLNPRTASSSSYELTIYTDVDYRNRNLQYTENIGYVGGTLWDVTPWSTAQNQISFWATDRVSEVQSQWIMNSAVGVKASVVFKTKTKGVLIDWFETGIRFETGSGIV